MKLFSVFVCDASKLDVRFTKDERLLRPLLKLLFIVSAVVCVYAIESA